MPKSGATWSNLATWSQTSWPETMSTSQSASTIMTPSSRVCPTPFWSLLSSVTWTSCARTPKLTEKSIHWSYSTSAAIWRFCSQNWTKKRRRIKFKRSRHSSNREHRAAPVWLRNYYASFFTASQTQFLKCSARLSAHSASSMSSCLSTCPCRLSSRSKQNW